MKRAGRARRFAILDLCPSDTLIIDVGADHGHIAHTVGGIATERMPQRSGRTDVDWVIADGLLPFRQVPCAVIAGMGAETIVRILDNGPRPAMAILHAQDDPPKLRRMLATRGWRIDAEALAPEARRFAEVLRIVPGEEPSTGFTLEFGPRLLADGHPLLLDHLRQLCQHYGRIATQTKGRATDAHTLAMARLTFLQGEVDRHGS
ncbi:MAG: tRNA A22 N-methylase [Myxococcota bacterium]|jgi:tRNA A22 N-methylase